MSRSDAATPPEHWRYGRHLETLAVAPGGSAEAEAVAAVLRDPDPVMAESAVVTHLDRRAARLLADEGFPAWARAMAAALAGRAFPERRLRGSGSCSRPSPAASPGPPRSSPRPPTGASAPPPSP